MPRECRRTKESESNKKIRVVDIVFLMRASGVWHGPIVTRIEAYRRFYPAETYHQDFMAANPGNPYIQHWDAPKVAALRRLFPAEYKRAFTRG